MSNGDGIVLTVTLFVCVCVCQQEFSFMKCQCGFKLVGQPPPYIHTFHTFHMLINKYQSPKTPKKNTVITQNPPKLKTKLLKPSPFLTHCFHTYSYITSYHLHTSSNWTVIHVPLGPSGSVSIDDLVQNTAQAPNIAYQTIICSIKRQASRWFRRVSQDVGNDGPGWFCVKESELVSKSRWKFDPPHDLGKFYPPHDLGIEQKKHDLVKFMYPHDLGFQFHPSSGQMKPWSSGVFHQLQKGREPSNNKKNICWISEHRTSIRNWIQISHKSTTCWFLD